MSRVHGDADGTSSAEGQSARNLHLATNPPPELPEPPLSRPLPPPPPLPAERLSSPRGDVERDRDSGKTTRADIIAIAVLAALVGGMLFVLISRIVGQ